MKPYHFDLRSKPTAAGPDPAAGRGLLRCLTMERLHANPVDVVQLGLGAVQMGSESWLPIVAETVAWLEREMDDDGLLAFHFPMPHTFPLDPPWHSALAQGEAASFLVRAAALFGRSDLTTLAELAIASLLRDDSELVAPTDEGPVLQEYPTAPPAHVLNGWITALWGLYDVAEATPEPATAAAAATAFEAGVSTLTARIGLYRTPIGWSRYDLFPHPVTNVASPAYHRLHVGHLRALNELAPRAVLAETADEWERSAASLVARSFAFGRKALFRVTRPRSRRIVPRERPHARSG